MAEGSPSEAPAHMGSAANFRRRDCVRHPKWRVRQASEARLRASASRAAQTLSSRPIVGGTQEPGRKLGARTQCSGDAVRRLLWPEHDPRRTMSENETPNGAPSRMRRTTGAARSGLDVMLTEAAAGGPPRFLAPGPAVKVGAGLVRHPRRVAARATGLAAELARAAAGRSRLAPAKGDRRFADPAWEGNWLLRRLLQSYLAVGRDRRRPDLRRRRGLARRAARAARRGKRARRARADELPVVEPDGDQGDGQHRRRQPRARRAAARARSVDLSAAAGDGRHEQIRGRPQPGRVTRDRWCCAPTCSSCIHYKPSTASRCARCRCCSSRRRSTSTTSSTSLPGAA